NNILDLDAALCLVADLGPRSCAIIKHGNPSGAALGEDGATAFRRALACDPVSAFGGVIAFHDPVDGAAAEAIAQAVYEGVLAPSFDADALRILGAKKNLRVLATGDLAAFSHPGYDLRRVHGGLLVQDWDVLTERIADAQVATRRAPTPDELKALQFAW